MASKKKRGGGGGRGGSGGRPGSRPAPGARPASAARPAPSDPADFRADAYRSVRENMAAAVPRRRRWDLVLSIVLCLLLGVVCVAISYLGAILSVFPARCDVENIACDFDRIDWGVALALLGPTATTVVAVGVTVIRYLFGKRAFWVPMAGIVICIVIGFAASGIVTGAIPGSALA